MKEKRRSFLNYLIEISGLGFLGSIFYPLFKYLTPPKGEEASLLSVVAGKVGELKINSSKIFKFGSKPGILILTSNGFMCLHTYVFNIFFKGI